MRSTVTGLLFWFVGEAGCVGYGGGGGELRSRRLGVGVSGLGRGCRGRRQEKAEWLGWRASW